MTGMPVVVAEELDADWTKVKLVPPPSNPLYGNPGFGGAQIIAASRTTRSFFMPLRLAGAQARRVLLDAVAAEWNVPVSELSTEPDRKSTRLNSSHGYISYAVFCLKKKKNTNCVPESS